MEDKLAWLAQVKEDILEPERPIIDPHHHLWENLPRFAFPVYRLGDLLADTGSGHNVKKTVFVECGANYRSQGDEAFYPLGETEFVKVASDNSQNGPPEAARIAGIVGHVDLMLGARAGEVLDAHLELAPTLFKGIRHVGAWDPSDEISTPHSKPTQTLYEERPFREGFRELAKRGLSFDAWNLHHTIPRLTSLARANPDVAIILDHFGGPVGIGAYKDKKAEIFVQWKKDIAELAKCDNVVAKLGGMAMPLNGYEWHNRATPPTSDEFVAAQKDHYHYAIEQFGPDRCMFESNYPMEKATLPYHVLWNAFKKIAASYSDSEKNAMFYDTAARVYRL